MATDSHRRPNDGYKLDDLPPDIVQALDCWANDTPNEPALMVPRGTTVASGIDVVTFSEWRKARNITVEWFRDSLGLALPADLALSTGARTVTCLIFPTQDCVTPLLALASMGYTTQFISPAHQPRIVANLIQKSGAQYIVHSNMDHEWLQQVKEELWFNHGGHSISFVELPPTKRLTAMALQIRAGNGPSPVHVDLHIVKPDPFVFLHSFGSTSHPKLYPISLSAANMSAKDSAAWIYEFPPEKRWRCQLLTSLPFHFSFQNPLWRSLKCGTAIAFSLCATRLNTTMPLLPNATDILNSLWLSGADLLYATPCGLQEMLELACAPDAPIKWKEALKNIKAAHTGAAPVSQEKADCYHRHNLPVLQVFALTETGLMFYAHKEITGHTTWLKPLDGKSRYMLYRRIPGCDDLYELWLKADFPGLLRQSVKLEPYPEDPSITAWNTSDTFRKVQDADGQPEGDLVIFAGRQDDWIRCTNGAAVRAMELEDYLSQSLRDALGFERIRAITVIGSGRCALGVVVQFDKPGEHPDPEEREAIVTAVEFINDKLLQPPAVLKPSHFIHTDSSEPIRMTLKASLLRKENEAVFGPLLDEIIASD